MSFIKLFRLQDYQRISKEKNSNCQDMAQLHGCLYAFFCEVFASTIGLIHVFLCERAGTIILLSIASFYFCCEVSAINTILQDPSSKKDFFNILVDTRFYKP